MKPRRHRPSAWELREGDLPSAETIALEPRLDGLENNAAFRAIVFHRHRQGLAGRMTEATGEVWNALIVIGATLAISFFFIALVILVPGLVVGSLLVFLVLFPFIMYAYLLCVKGVSAVIRSLASSSEIEGDPSGRIRTGQTRILSIPTRLFVELARSGATATDLARGYWGSVLIRQRLRRQRRWLVLLMAVAFVALVYEVASFAPANLPWTSFLISFALVSCGALGNHVTAPHHVLACAVSEIDREARIIKANRTIAYLIERYLSVLGSAAPPVVKRCAVGFLLWLVLGAAMAIHRGETGSRLFDFEEGLTVMALTLVGAFAAFQIGWLRGRGLRLSSDSYFAQMCEHVDEILNWIKDDRPHAGSGPSR